MLELRNVDKIYHPGTVMETRLFTKFNLKVERGSFVSVVGSNGSGKTSLLNILCGSVPVSSGEVLLNGRDVRREAEFRRYETMGRVYQDPAMGTCPNLTILENLSLADQKGKPYGLSAGVNRRKTEAYRAMLAELGLGLQDKMGVKMGSLSGGQRQAVALLMATMTPIEILLLDEHTAALDPKTADLIMELTDRIVREKQLTALMVTHNLRYAVAYGDRLLMMDHGEIVLDCCGAEKRQTTVADVLALFNRISVECGN